MRKLKCREIPHHTHTEAAGGQRQKGGRRRWTAWKRPSPNRQAQGGRLRAYPSVPVMQVDEETPLWGARPVWGACESQPATAAETLCPHGEEVEQPPPDLQVGTATQPSHSTGRRLLAPLPTLAEASGFIVGLSGRLPFPEAHPRVPSIDCPICSHAEKISRIS